ncbi:hypothetical protein TNCV_2784801 [Trichonephila clavipes]|nr:hypothetical protein TNCV_2784801 [Trichonephila clavipes]
MYNKELQVELIHQPEADVSLMTNHQLEEKIVKQFKQIKIVIKKKRKIIMHKNSNLLEQEDLKKLEENDLIDKVAFILRSTILKMDKTTLPAVMKMEDLINGEYTIPEKLDRFFKALIGGKDIRRRDGVNCHRLSNSLASGVIYCVSNGTVKPSKHITLGMTVKSLTSSRKMNNILNRLGHCCNYNTLEELETEATISSLNRSQICPPDIIQCPSLSTGVTFDNFDRYVDTLTGKDTLHDTVGIIYKKVSDDYDIELNSSSISGNIDIPLPPTKEDGLLTRKFQNYRRLIIDCKSARQRWTKSHSIRATIISHVLDVCGLKQLQDVSADLQPNRIKIYGKQLSDFNEIFENNINPLDESLDKDSLCNIATAKPVPENVANILLNIEKNGEDLRKQFITECALKIRIDLICQ